MKITASFKKRPIFFIALLLACTVFFASCGDDTSSNSSPPSPNSNTQTSTITPIGAQATCMTINSPSLVKLANGHYQLLDEVGNCGGKAAGPIKINAQISAKTTTLSTNLWGPAIIQAKGKAMYHTFKGKTSTTDKEIYFPATPSSPAVVMISVTINGTVQGEWDGQITIPA